MLGAATELLADGVEVACRLRALKEGSDTGRDPSEPYRIQAERDGASAFAEALDAHRGALEIVKDVEREGALAIWTPAADQKMTYKAAKALADSLDALGNLIRKLVGKAKSAAELSTKLKFYSEPGIMPMSSSRLPMPCELPREPLIRARSPR